MLRLAAKALAAGGEQVSRKRIEWDISGSCQSPIGRDVTLKAVEEKRRIVGMTSAINFKRQSGVVKITRPPRSKVLPLGFVVGLTVRCRKCEKCRRQRRVMWSERAKREVHASVRTWFGTLTLRPDEQFRILTLARHRQNQQGIDYDMLPYGEQFQLRVSAFSPDITDYIKRVRKECAAPLRYLWVSEAHKSGSPHFHALVHEVLPEMPVTYDTLSNQWPHGFTKWKLVKSLSEATYLTKYLSKSTASRVRASVDYGKTTTVIDAIKDVHRDLIEIKTTHENLYGLSCQTQKEEV